MSGVDERIVEMTFKASSFVQGVKSTVDALSALKNSLNGLKGSDKDINALDSAGKRFSLKGMASGIEAIGAKFKALSVIGITALATIVNSAVQAGLRMVKALTIDPIKAGLDVYETKINAIKTILANTEAEGTTLKQVTDALNLLNVYANKTVYNFGQMAKNIGTFTAAGVNLKDSVASIKGIANLAALSGSSAEQASTAMYQLSQAIATGVLRLQDWNSVVNAGLGGKVFQNALIETARVNGVAIDAILKKNKGFRNSLQAGWLTSKILTQTLAQFTGDLSDAQLRAMGFTAKETAAIQKQAASAVSSATQIRTVTQLFQALKEEVATAWSRVFEALIGNIGQATHTLSALHNTLENFFTKPINSLASYLQEWNKLGGRAKLIDAFTNAFKFLGAIMRTIGDAFKAIFPPSTTNTLLTITTALDNFSKHLILSSQGAKDLKATFEGVFSIFKIVIDVIGAVARGLGIMFGAAGSGGGGLLHLTAAIGSFITKVKDAIESGGILTKFFEGLGRILSLPIRAIGAIIGALGGLGGAISKAVSFMQPFIDKVKSIFSGLAGAIGSGITSGNFSALAELINHILAGSVLLAVRHFILGLGKSSGKGLFAGLKDSFENLTKTLEVMQANLKAGILQKIAIAIALLAASMLVLSLVNPKDLAKSLAAMTVMFLQMLGAMAIIIKLSKASGFLAITAIAFDLNLLATAILILAGAVAILAQFSWEQLAKGLGSIAVLLAELVISTSIMSTDSKGLITSAIAMGIMAVSLNILALAVKQLGSIPTGNLVKGVVAIAAILAILAGFNAISGAQLIGTATAMVILGAALNIIAHAVATLGALSVGTLAKGLISIAAALGIIAIAMALMPPTMFVTALSLLLVAAALVVLSKALTTMGGMSWSEIAKSLIELAASLVIIAAAMALMTEALPGAAALLVVAASLAILTPVLLALGGMSWSSIAKSLVELAGAFVIIGLAGLVLTPLVPTLIGIGLALTLMGVGILAAGAGLLLFGAGLTAIALAVTASGAAIFSFVKSMLSLIPMALEKIGEGIVAFAGAIAKGGAAITAAFVTILSALLKGIIKVEPLIVKTFSMILTDLLHIINKYAPSIVKTFLNLIQTLLNGIQSHLPEFIRSGVNIIISLLHGITANMQRIAIAGTNACIAFINAIGNSIQRIVAAGVRMVINLVNGIANQIRASSGAMNAAARNLGSAIIQGIIGGVLSGIGGVISAVVNAAQSALSAAMHAIGANSPSKKFMEVGRFSMLGWAKGTLDNRRLVNDAVEASGRAALDTLSKTMSSVGVMLSDSMDLQPRITPVIDLTEAKKGFSQLSDLSKSQLISATASTAKAASISASNNATAATIAAQQNSGVNLTFNQTNTSPEPLSAATIYRQTKNQLSISRGALSKYANVG